MWTIDSPQKPEFSETTRNDVGKTRMAPRSCSPPTVCAMGDVYFPPWSGDVCSHGQSKWTCLYGDSCKADTNIHSTIHLVPLCLAPVLWADMLIDLLASEWNSRVGVSKEYSHVGKEKFRVLTFSRTQPRSPASVRRRFWIHVMCSGWRRPQCRTFGREKRVKIKQLTLRQTVLMVTRNIKFVYKFAFFETVGLLLSTEQRKQRQYRPLDNQFYHYIQTSFRDSVQHGYSLLQNNFHPETFHDSL